MVSSLSSVLMRSPPITNGHSRPSSPFTFSMAARIARAFSSLVKSVSGSLRNSVGTSVSSVVNGLRRPLAGLLQFLDLSFHDFALERRHLVDEDYAIAVIGFMQHATRCQFCSVKFEVFAVNVVRTNDCAQFALNVEKDAGERKASFI